MGGGGEWEGHQGLGGRLAGRRWRAGGKCRIPLVRRANPKAILRASAPTNRNQDHAPPMEAAAAYRCAARVTPDHSALRAKAPIPHSARRNHSLLPPISLHSTTSFSLVEKSKYPPSAQQKGRTRMSGFESQSAHNGAHSGTPSRRSPRTPQVQWKRALPLFSSHQGSSRVEVVRARQLGFVQQAEGDHSVTTLSAGPWCGPSFPCLLRDNPVGPLIFFQPKNVATFGQ